MSTGFKLNPKMHKIIAIDEWLKNEIYMEGQTMIRMLKTKSCTRCGGNLSLERDEYGAYVACIQCGAQWNEVTPARNTSELIDRRPLEMAKRVAVAVRK